MAAEGSIISELFRDDIQKTGLQKNVKAFIKEYKNTPRTLRSALRKKLGEDGLEKSYGVLANISEQLERLGQYKNPALKTSPTNALLASAIMGGNCCSTESTSRIDGLKIKIFMVG